MTRRSRCGYVLVALLAAGCGSSSEPENLTEIQRVRSGMLEVVLLSADPSVNPGEDTFVVEFRSADGQLVDVGEVTAAATMPMPGMAPMAGTVDIRRTGAAGRYAVTSTLSMTGDWRLTIEWKGPAGTGSAGLSLAVQS